jgi:hypothetical protein
VGTGGAVWRAAPVVEERARVEPPLAALRLTPTRDGDVQHPDTDARERPNDQSDPSDA